MDKMKEIEYYLIDDKFEFWPSANKIVSRTSHKEILLHYPATCCFLKLIKNQPNIVSQNDLMEAGWGERHQQVSVNAFYQTILTLRRTLRESGLKKDIVRTIPRRGLKIPTDIIITLQLVDNDEVDSETIPTEPSKETAHLESYITNEVSSDPISDELTSPTLMQQEPLIEESHETHKQTHTIVINDKITKKNKSRIKNIYVPFVITIIALIVFYYSYSFYQRHDFTSAYEKSDIHKDNCDFYFNKGAVIFDRHMNYVKENTFDCSKLNAVFITTYFNSTQLSVLQCKISGGIIENKYCTSKYYTQY